MMDDTDVERSCEQMRTPTNEKVAECLSEVHEDSTPYVPRLDDEILTTCVPIVDEDRIQMSKVVQRIEEFEVQACCDETYPITIRQGFDENGSSWMADAMRAVDCIKMNFNLESSFIDKHVQESLNTILGISNLSNYIFFPAREKNVVHDIGELLRDSGVSRMLCDMIIYALNNEDWRLINGPWLKQDLILPFQTTVQVLFNFSDQYHDLTVEMCSVDGLMKGIIVELNKYMDGNVHDDNITEVTFFSMIKTFLGLCYNCCVVDENREKLYELDLPAVLLRYATDCEDDTCRLVAILGLAEILDESGCKKFHVGPEPLKFLFGVLKRALQRDAHREGGWSVLELTRGIQHLALCDSNKRTLVENGVLTILRDIAWSNVVLEQREALGVLWTLSFNKDNRKTILNESTLMGNLKIIRKSKDAEVRRIVAGIMWTLHEKDDAVGSHSIRLPGAPEEQHIMISYQTASRDILLRVRDALKDAGFKVWMDVDDISGSTIQSMAEAVQNACVILMSVSRKYNDSHNCRAEAEYAYTNQKHIIPLMLQSGYKPEGWLGFIMGSKKYFRFTSRSDFDDRFRELVKDIKLLVQAEGNAADDREDKSVNGSMIPNSHREVFEQPIVSTGDKAVKVPHTFSSSVYITLDRVAVISQWSPDTVANWKYEHSLKYRSNLTTEADDISGKELAFLWKAKQEASQYFYHLVETMLHIDHLRDMAQFVEEFEKLFTST